ncbi:MAG: amidohydrolase family protein [Myxococcota bacterium]|nr:amidohydrolase family protein [Myxococcota bacterium]
MNDTTLTGLRIWDGRETLDADAIRISDGRIRAIGDARELAPGSETRDCGGLFALPGLIDAHVHMELDPEHKEPPPPGYAPAEEELLPPMAERARGMVQAGITTARDLGGGTGFELLLRDRIARGELPGPRLLCVGQPVTSPGGHCHFWGGEAADLAEARRVITRQVDRGADWIKVMATGGRMTKGTQPSRAQFDLETLSGIVAFAGEQGRSVAAHCHGTEGIDFAARAGVRTIEHCSWVGEEGWASDYQPEIAAKIKHHQSFVSPTVNRGWRRMLDPKAEKLLQRLRAAFGDMLAREIPFVTSTDAGIPGVFHADLAHALDVFARIAALSPERTLRMATSEAAIALEIESETGRLAPGLAADLLLVEGNPLDDLSPLTNPALVFARGVPQEAAA